MKPSEEIVSLSIGLNATTSVICGWILGKQWPHRKPANFPKLGNKAVKLAKLSRVKSSIFWGLYNREAGRKGNTRLSK